MRDGLLIFLAFVFAIILVYFVAYPMLHDMKA